MGDIVGSREPACIGKATTYIYIGPVHRDGVDTPIHHPTAKRSPTAAIPPRDPVGCHPADLSEIPTRIDDIPACRDCIDEPGTRNSAAEWPPVSAIPSGDLVHLYSPGVGEVSASVHISPADRNVLHISTQTGAESEPKSAIPAGNKGHLSTAGFAEKSSSVHVRPGQGDRPDLRHLYSAAQRVPLAAIPPGDPGHFRPTGVGEDTAGVHTALVGGKRKYPPKGIAGHPPAYLRPDVAIPAGDILRAGTSGLAELTTHIDNILCHSNGIDCIIYPTSQRPPSPVTPAGDIAGAATPGLGETSADINIVPTHRDGFDRTVHADSKRRPGLG